MKLRIAVCLLCAAFLFFLVRRSQISDDKEPTASNSIYAAGGSPARGSESDSKLTAVGSKSGERAPDWEFLDQNPHWFAMSSDFKLKDEGREYLGLTSEEMDAVSKVVSQLREQSSEIFSQTGRVFSDPKDSRRSLVVLPPAPDSWAGAKIEFESKILDLVGPVRGEVLLERTQRQINLLTGDFGRNHRLASFVVQNPVEGFDIPPYLVRFYQGSMDLIPDWKSVIPSEISEEIDRVGPSVNSEGMSLTFSSPPDFLAGIIEGNGE